MVADATVADGWGPIWERVTDAHRVQEFACDPSGPGNLTVLSRVVRRLGARAYGAQNDVGEGLRRVTALLERAASRGSGPARDPALYVSDACVHTIGEFESYARRKARDGSILEAPAEVGDDAMDALRYAVMALTRGAGDQL